VGWLDSRSRDPLGLALVGSAAAIGLIAGGMGAVIPEFLAVAIGWALFRLGRGEYTPLRLFGAALAVRNCALVLVPMLGGGRYSPIFPDEADYVKLSLEAANSIFGLDYQVPTQIASMAGPDGLRRFTDDGFGYLMSPLAAVSGPSHTLPAIRATAAIWGALAVCAAWWAGSKLVGTRAGRRGAFLYAIFPTSIFWSAVALKESLAATLLLTGLGMTVMLTSKRGSLRWLMWASSLWVIWFLLLSIREHLVFVAGSLAIPAVALLSWTASRRNGVGRVVRSASAAMLAFVVASTALWAAGYGVLGKDVLKSLDPAFLGERSEMESRGGATIAPASPTSTAAPSDDTRPKVGRRSTVMRLAARLPETAFSLALRPYPWESPQGSLARFAGSARFFLIPSQLAWYAALLAGTLGGWRFVRRHPSHAFLPYGFALVLFFFYGITQANLGTAFRLREIFVPIVLLVAAVPRRLHVPLPEPSLGLVVPTAGPGGTEAHAFEISRRLKKVGRKTSLVVLSGPPPDGEGQRTSISRDDNDDFCCFAGRRSRYDLGLPLRLARILDSTECYSTYLFAGNFWGGLAARISGAALMSNIRTTHPRSPIQRMLEPLVVGELVVCNSEAVASAARRRGIPPRRIRVSRNGIDVDAVGREVRRDRKTVLAEIGIQADGFVACLPARFDSLKDQLTAVEAFRLSSLADRRDAWLVMAGSADLPQERSYKAKVATAAAGVEGIVILDYSQSIYELMSASDVVILSSIHEGLPNVLLEAGALAKPAIATAVGGSTEVVVDGETGLVVPPCDPAALAAALEQMASDPTKRQRLGGAARRRIESLFGIDAEVERFLQLSAECVKAASEADRPDTPRD
jgi:glycosyltransferase involved in cell wall biosynthesis